MIEHAPASSAFPVAVVGMALRVPGAATLERYWVNLVAARDCLTRRTDAELRARGASQALLSNPDFVRALPVVEDIDLFDADFFGLSAREASLADPAHRLFLECAWEALESAGIVPGRGAPVTGVFGGSEGNYLDEVICRGKDLRTDPALALPVRIGNAIDFLTTRVSHRLDLTGPSVGVMAACATSLVAIDHAIASLERGECEVALAGGSTVMVARSDGYVAGIEGMLSASGRLRPFDASADGTIFGSGAGVVALRPLDAAIAAGNPIHAIVLGSATNNDGRPPGKESFVAPSFEGQVGAIERALDAARVSPRTVGYVEAHGTGTRLGDPIEVAALTEVYRRHTSRTGYCSLGSVKANVGHLRTAAGVASFIKACLALEHRTRPPLANFERPNPRVDFEASPFVVHTDARDWPDGDSPRRAAVSSFGFGGANAHLILEEAPRRRARSSTRRFHLLPLSARTPAALTATAEELAAHLARERPGAAEVARTLMHGRSRWAHRACCVVEGDRVGPEHLAQGALRATGVARAGPASLVFLFDGQGAQRYGAGRALYAQEPVWREAIDACARALAPSLDLVALLGYGEGVADEVQAQRRLRDTMNAQPAMFALGYAAARLAIARGFAPSALLGHSLGELVAACVAGVFGLDDALALVAARGRLMQGCESGAMAAVFAPAHLVAERLPPTIEIAAINAPTVTVVAGPAAVIDAYCKAAADEGLATQRLETSHAFHSRAMGPAQRAFAAVVGRVELAPPSIPVISNLTGEPLTAAQATDPAYWSEHIRRPVRFSDGLRHLLALGNPVFAEMGPGAALCELVRRHDPDARARALVPAERGPDDQSRAFHDALAGLWCSGAEPVPEAAEDAGRASLVALPTYPFERRRTWYDDPDAASGQAERTLYERGFADMPLATPAAIDTSRPWFVVGAPDGIAGAVHGRLAAAGVDAVLAEPEGRLDRAPTGGPRLDPSSREDWLRLFALRPGSRPRVLLATALDGRDGVRNDAPSFAAAQRRGLDALAALAQAAFEVQGDPDLDVFVLTDQLARIDGEKGERSAAQAALLGGSRAVRREMPGLRLRVVDVPADPRPAERETLAAMLVDEAQADTDATLVALRAGRRAEERLYVLPEPPRGPRPRLREGGVVLVTGGTGGLGLLFAEALFDACRARLVLTARWQPPPESEWPERARGGDRIARALARVLALRARGADVTIVRADVGSRTDLAAVLDAVRERHGELHGVVHAAGTSSRELVLQRTAGNAADVLAPKAVGALHLDELLGDAPLDLYLPVSSTATQTPLPGQFDYAAANAVLDALAANRAERHGGVACAIGWGPWQEVGIAVDRLRESLEASQARERERAAGLETTPLDHPILRERERLQGERHCYRGSLRRGMWVVDDHRLDGRPILSGTTTLQLVTTAFRDHAGGDGAVELNDVVFRRPLFTAGPGMDLEIRFEPSGADERFELASRTSGGGGVFEVNATGFARGRTGPPSMSAPPLVPEHWVDAPRARDFGGARLSGGPRWGWRRWEREDGEWVQSRIVLPDAFVDDLPVYDLHPALLDAATQGLRGVGAEAVPYTYDAVRVHGSLEREIYAHASSRRAGDETVHDIVVTNGSGSVLVELEGFLVRRIAGSNLGERPEVTNGAARRVVVTEPGNLDSLALEPFEPPLPGPGEVLVEVRATGLNFRDVLTALGEMPRAHEGPYVPGSEASGVVRAVGAGVTRLAVGDAVVTIARSALATHVIAPAHATVAMPANLDFERAAGLPIVFLTACHALEDLARLQRGERVLIHAGAGGVGLAAIQVARALHARVFATAGSEDKRAYLRTLGVEAVFDSRSLDFVEGVREATGGEGVDVVLNSLAGEFIPASLSVLAPEGRFVEIGKRDLLADANLALAPFLRNLTFSAFDLGQMVDRAHPRLPAMFDTLMDRFARGELTPPPTAIVPLDTAGEGFRRMARAKHVGKIVFAVDREAAARGELARAFESNYGEGVPVAWGLDVFRRSLNWLGAPPFVLATGRTSDVANLEARSRPAAEAQRGRDGLATAYRPPGTPVERALVALWERTLGFEPVGIDDDFVDLGGDSIESIQVLHAILRDFGLRIRNTDFLAAPTIAQLASRIEAARAGSPEAQEASFRAEREAP